MWSLSNAVTRPIKKINCFLEYHFLHFLHRYTKTHPGKREKSVKSEGLKQKTFFMPTLTKPYRYQLPKKAIKSDCPQCGPKYRKTLSLYIDSQTGEILPKQFGRCDRESNCGYNLSPYTKGPSGISYADEVSQLSSIPREWFKMAAKWKRLYMERETIINKLVQAEGATQEQAEQVIKYVFSRASLSTLFSPTPIYSIPEEVVVQSLGYYDQNQFAKLLVQQFGQNKANGLLKQFRIGTSALWPGSCVFWLNDEQKRVRAGQVVLFADDWHKATYLDKEGQTKPCISSVSHGLIRRYSKQGQPAPDWLTDYHKNAPRWPILFGLHQLLNEPVDKPIAIVEAPKTAVVCSALISDFVWLAVGALSYLNADRLAPLRGRVVMLFPDLSKDGKAFAQWSRIADQMNAVGYQIKVSTLLEQGATDEQRTKGLDLADFLLIPAKERPRWIIDGQTIYGEVLEPEPSEQSDKLKEPTLRPFIPPETRVAHPNAPLSFDAAEQLQAVKWCVLPINAIE